jgi:hypothetical protein
MAGSEKSYRVYACLILCDLETSTTGRHTPDWGSCARNKQCFHTRITLLLIHTFIITLHRDSVQNCRETGQLSHCIALATGRKNGGSNTCMRQDIFTFSGTVQSESGTQPSSYSKDTGGPYFGGYSEWSLKLTFFLDVCHPEVFNTYINIQ